MISWRRVVANKPLLSCLLMLVMLSFLLYSDQWFPRAGEGFGKEETKEVEAEIFIPNSEIRQTAANISEPVKKVLLLSSLGRSGSSFLGEILAAQENTIYFFEPIRASPSASSYLDKTDELLRYFNCTVRNTVFVEGYKPNYIIVKSPEKIVKNRITPDTVVKRCLAAPQVIIKTIRTSLKWVLARVQRNEFHDVKVIHLVRDPRGSFISMEKRGWKATKEGKCDHIFQDLQDKKTMMSLCPSRYIFVTYENLCRDPYGQARRLMRFIHDQGDEQMTTQSRESQTSVNASGREVDWGLPEDVRQFLRDHLQINMWQVFDMMDPFSTVRTTSSMYQRWRWTITQKELEAVEAACQNVIEALGHRMFHNLTAVRNASLSLFIEETDNNKTHSL